MKNINNAESNKDIGSQKNINIKDLEKDTKITKIFILILVLRFSKFIRGLTQPLEATGEEISRFKSAITPNIEIKI